MNSSSPESLPADPEAASVDALLERSAALHRHLCPRQVLGVRMGLVAGRALGLSVPRDDKRLLVFVETDGCFADGVSVATGCWLGRRTMRLVDHGKVAAVFVDTRTGVSVRVAPRSGLRGRALDEHRPGARSRWHAYLDAYRAMSDEELFAVRPVRLNVSVADIVSDAGRRVVCVACGEEIVNGREVVRGAQVLCRDCAGDAYFTPLGS